MLQTQFIRELIVHREAEKYLIISLAHSIVKGLNDFYEINQLWTNQQNLLL